MFSSLKALMKIGFFSYGGGNAIIPFFYKEFVETGKISEEEFNKNVLLTNVTPGTAQVKIASSSAYSLGVLSSVLSAYSIAIPSFILVITLLSLYSLLPLSLVDQINQFSVGIYIFVAFMLIKYISNGLSSVKDKDRKVTWIVFFTTIFLTFGNEMSEFISYFASLSVDFKKLTVEYIYIFVAALLIAFFTSRDKRRAHSINSSSSEFKYPLKILLAFALIGFIAMIPTFNKDITSYYLSVFASTITSFGGGSAYISSAESFFVQSGMIPQEYFYGIILIVAYALPGPTLTKVVSGVGFYIGYQNGGILGGIIVSFASLAISIFATNLIFVLAQWIYSRYDNANFFENLKKLVTPVIYGVLVVTTLSVVNLSFDILLENDFTATRSVVFLGVSLFLVHYISKKIKTNDVCLFLMCGLYSFAVINFF